MNTNKMNSDFSPTKLHSLMLLILNYLNREFGKIEFAKLIYLIDAEAIELLGAPISEDGYTRQERGPLVNQFYNALRDMLGHEIELERTISIGFSSFGKHALRPGKDPRFEPNLSEVEIVLAQKVLDRLANLSPRELEEEAYNTEPMKAILELEKSIGSKAQGTDLDMSLIKKDEGLARWQKNVAKLKQVKDRDYEKFIRAERAETRKFIEAKG